jgi:glyoxylase-like metal-dependent hydrolase (beta-lactamase superfamily II)
VIDVIAHGGVTEWRFATRLSRLAGYAASAFLTDDGLLIDTGIPACGAAFERLLDAVAVRGVVITHHHEDHAGNVERVARRGIPTWISPATVPLVTTVARLRAYRRLTWKPMPPLTSAVTPFAPTSLEILPTPGHSTDHHVIWQPGTRTLFSGDLFLGVAVRIMQAAEDPWQCIDSLERAAALGPVRMFCAHRGLVPEPVTALRAKAQWLRDTITSVTDAISLGATDSQILVRVLGGESLTGRLSGGEYARRNFVRAVRRGVVTQGR